MSAGPPDGTPAPDPGVLDEERPGWVPADHDAPARGLAAFRELLEEITYKPDYWLTVENPQLAGNTNLVIHCALLNTYRPSEVTPIAMRFTLPRHVLERWGASLHRHPRRTRDEMLRFVHKCLGWHELHERDEWLVVGGARPFDPHADGRNQPFVPG